MKKFDSIKIRENSVIIGSGIKKGELDKKLKQVKKIFSTKSINW